ncbi:hypothetical protein, partial [uncultured Muribaculum sp.]
LSPNPSKNRIFRRKHPSDEQRQSLLTLNTLLYSPFIAIVLRILRIFDYILDTHARQCPNNFGIALDLFVSLQKDVTLYKNPIPKTNRYV